LSGYRLSVPAGRLLRLVLVSTLFLFPAPSTLAAEDAAEKARELQALRSQIQALQEELAANRKRKSGAETKLHEIERQIGQTSRVLRQIDADLQSNREQLDTLRNEQRIQAEKLRQQREQLAREARAAYAMGRQQQIKLLLNQEQPAAVSRMMTYFGYLSRARSEQIEAMRATWLTLRQLEDSIGSKTSALLDLRNQRVAESEQLQAQQQARKRAIAGLSRELRKQGGELKRLKSNERQLQELVHSLQELLADIPPDSGQQQPFKNLKGQLRWPAQGHLAQRFGTQRGISGLRWQGVVIAAPEGGSVHTVAQGRVAFADWMRGFGLLLIIDHGDGYMSLYGHNQALYKEVGDWVDSGDMVATLGASGGQIESGLYFELRYKGRPINPIRWCKGKPAAVSG
jgi:septal ring factor EnvC (AmiA/AmiB activator)